MKFKERTKIAIYVIILLISVIVDVLILNGWLKTYLVVSNNYIDSVFSGILTYSTISLTLLSIIIAIIDVKIYGLKLKEILSFESSPIKFISFIIFLAVLTFLSIIALAFNMCTFISFISVISILHITQTSVNVFKIVLNNKLAKEIILEEIKSNSNDLLFNYVASWINEFKNALTNNNISEIEEYAEILKKCTSNKDLVNVIKKQLPELFDASLQYHSFSESYFLVVKSLSLHLSFNIYDEIENYIKHIQYYDEYRLINFNIQETITDIINSDKLNSNEKVTLSYYFFNAVIYCNVTEKVKLDILGKCINVITVLQEEKNGVEKSKLIYKILIYDIIVEDSDVNLKLYERLLKSLYLNNKFNFEKVFIETIAKIFRAMYFYGTLATDIFDEKKRNKIKQISKYIVSIDDITKISIETFIFYHLNTYEILCYYILDSYSDEFKYINISISNSISKAFHNIILWDYKNKIKFAVWFFFAVSFQENKIPIDECFEEMQKNRALSNKQTINLCNAILEEYKYNLCVLTESCLKKVVSFDDYINNIFRVGFINQEKIRNVHDTVIRKIQECKKHS